MRFGWRRWLLRCLCWAYLPWAVIPMVFAVLLPDELFREKPWLWDYLLYSWTAACFCVFIHTLVSPKWCNEHSVLRGLIAAVGLGLPAAGLTLLGYSLSFADLPLALNEESEVLGEEEFAAPNDDSRPTAFLFALDISGSFMSARADSKIETDLKMEIVKDVLSKVFLEDNPLFPHGSCATILTFASQPQVIKTVGEFGSAECAGFQENLDGVAHALTDKLRRRPQMGEETKTTDLLELLGSLVAQLDRVDESYSAISVVLMSDLYHDVGRTDAGWRERWEDIEQAMINLESHVQFMVLLDDESTQAKTGFRLNPQQDGLDGRWREVGLTEYRKADPEQRLALLALNLFPSIETRKLHLKYRVAPRPQAITAHINLPNSSDFQRIALGLVSAPGDEVAMSRVRLNIQHFIDRKFTLTTAPLGGHIRLLDRAGREFVLTLANPTDLGRTTKCNLLLAVPKRGRVYRVPVDMVPILSETSRSFFLVLEFFGACAVIGLTARAFWDKLLSTD